MPKIKHRKSEEYPNYKQKHSRIYENDYDEYDEEDKKPRKKVNRYEESDFVKYMYEQFEKTKAKPKTVEEIRKSVCTYEYSTPAYEGREDSIGAFGFTVAFFIIIAIGLAL